ncbi:hypothetical protein BBJ28_00023835 [Nothophytophthora sp. Chile5]|nr:hypothetical protein BBJ28_00023835 [Nothophytophthora sp. Chile5]
MGMALEQLFVRVSDVPGASSGGETRAQQVARACGLAVDSDDGDAATKTHCTITGFADTRQQLAVACLLHWQLQQEAGSGAEPPVVSVSDAATGTCFSLPELLGCEKNALEEAECGAVRVLNAAEFVAEALQQEDEVEDEKKKVQVVDCRSEREFLGVVSAREVSGHLEGAKNVPFASIFTADSGNADDEKDNEATSTEKSGSGAFLLPVEELRGVFEVAGTDLERPIAVVASDPAEAAAVATVLLLAGHKAWVAFCSVALTDKLVTSFPSSYTPDVFQRDRLLYADDAGGFDLSPAMGGADTTEHVDTKLVEELEKAYQEQVDGKKAKKKRGDEEEEDKTEEIVWVKDGRRFFDMPSPVSKAVFLDASRAIFRMASFVLAPFGFPAALREKRTLEEVKTICGALFQDVIEVCSDLIYQHRELNEGAMAMSVHKWVEEKRDHECTAQVKAINEIWQVLYTPPAVVEVPDLTEDHVVELATQLDQKLREQVSQRTPWAFDTMDEDDEASKAEPVEATETDETDVDSDNIKEPFSPVDDLAESWKYMYPSVIYTLGFIPQDPEVNHKKLSTLQIKSFIQAAAEASWDVMGAENEQLSQVEFQALCETLSGEKREQVAERGHEAEKALYVLKHYLTRSLETDDSLAEKLAAVRDAVQDGDIRRRSGRHQVALASYLKAFEHLPLYHKELENAVVGRARCFLELDDPARAKTEALIALKMNPFSAGAYECLGSVEEKSEHPDVAMQHYVTSFILDGSRSPEHAESIDRVSRFVGRRVAKGLFANMEKVHELPSAWLVESYFESFEHDADNSARVPFDIAKQEDAEQSDLDALTLLHRAIHHKRNKTFGEAQRDIWTLVARDMEAEGLTAEQRALALNFHASLLYVAGDVHAAVEVITQSLELQPTSVNSLVKKGGFLSEMGETEEATACFAEAMELDPNEADVHLHMGQMELLDGHYYKAVQCLRRCISRSDALPVTHVSYGMALYKSGSTYQAKDVFKEASKKFPESAEVHLFHGEVLADQGDYAEAMRHFLTAWDLSPQCPLPFLNAGRVYVGTNDPMRAIAHFQQALDVDPRCSSAHLDIAQVLFAQGRTREAFEHFDVAASCCRFLPEVEEVCACQEMAKMQLKVTEILGVELRHIMRSK